MAKRILLVDDAAFMRKMIKDTLSKNGYTDLHEAVDGADAVEKFTELKPDLVIMDIESFTRREKMLQLRENLLVVEEDRAMGRNGCTIDELDSFLDGILNEG